MNLKTSIRTGLRKVASVIRNNRAVAVVGGAAVSSASFAQTAASIDVSAVTGYIQEGVVALAAVGVAFLGFRYLKKVYNKI